MAGLEETGGWLADLSASAVVLWGRRDGAMNAASKVAVNAASKVPTLGY
eukprot:CAMPEP_0171635860 /NCGR_PEP_ID=MMETSP0990-20121206/26995_1 /TAXON_ID=483369 /ORGANISM="non described non described, Strain CCMP2098" /LENGTH=48 /DNA_ID= /DNA_START= /DNA_END= /DNA_ORIENTATION=